MIPKDPVILLSYVNTMLRDKYPSLCELACAEGIEAGEIVSALEKIDYAYDENVNQFV